MNCMQGAGADSGIFSYGHDALNRLTEVGRDGQLLRRYTYDAFGNRLSREDHGGQTPALTTYRYDAGNRLVSLASGGEEETHAYDRRGNLTAVYRGEELLRAYTYDAANRMTGALQIKDGMEKRVEYGYNVFGNRTGQDIYVGSPGTDVSGPRDPERRTRHTTGPTRRYHNLLVSETEDGAGRREQVFYWDGNVASMGESGTGMSCSCDGEGNLTEVQDTVTMGLALGAQGVSQACIQREEAML